MRCHSGLRILLILVVFRTFAQEALAESAAAHKCSGAPSPVVPTRVFPDIEPRKTTAKLENPLRRGIETPLVMLAFGDSPMWGNGLEDAHKYVHLVAQYVADGTGRTVKLITYAHSGANIADETDSCYEPIIPAKGIPSGDLNAGLPTVLQQEEAAAASRNYQEAELILVDGCINDVNAEKIALPFPFSGLKPEDVRVRTHQWCSDKMLGLLQSTTKDFPVATVIVSNYWLIISKQSKPWGFALSTSLVKLTPADRDTYGRGRDLLEIELKAERETGQQLTPVSALTNTAALFQKWSANSHAFLDTSETCFDWAVASVDGRPTKPNTGNDSCPGDAGHVKPQEVTPTLRVFLAKVSEESKYSYGAGKEKRLWSVPGYLGHPKDEVYSERGALCDSLVPDRGQRYVCHVNPTAHPNVSGADAYRQSIGEVMAAAWKK
jgi:hypothetical protein